MQTHFSPYLGSGKIANVGERERHLPSILCVCACNKSVYALHWGGGELLKTNKKWLANAKVAHTGQGIRNIAVPKMEIGFNCCLCKRQSVPQHWPRLAAASGWYRHLHILYKVWTGYLKPIISSLSVLVCESKTPKIDVRHLKRVRVSYHKSVTMILAAF